MFIKFSMPSGVPRNLLFNTVESDDFLDVLTSGYIRRNGQKQVVSCHTIVFIYNLLRNIQEHDVGFHTCLLSLGHNPEFTIKGSLKIVLGQVLHIGKGQARKAAEDVQIPNQLHRLAPELQIQQPADFIFRQIVPIGTFGRYAVIHEGVTDYPSVVLGNGNHTAQGHHVNPYRIVTALLFGAQEDVEVGDESRSKFFQRNIADTVAGLDELLQMFIDRAILVVSGWASQARINLFEKVLIVLGKDFQQGFVSHFQTQESVLHFLGSDIVIPLGYLLVFGIDADTYLVQETIGFQRNGTFSRSSIALDVPQVAMSITFATEKYSQSKVSYYTLCNRMRDGYALCRVQGRVAPYKASFACCVYNNPNVGECNAGRS